MITGCQLFDNPRISKEIILFGDTNCDNDQTCNLNLSELTPFEWDTLYVFKGYLSAASINRALGYRLAGKDIEDDWQKLIFVKDRQLVYSEEYPDRKFMIQFISIGYEEQNIYGLSSYSKNQAVFSVEKMRTFDGRTFLNLDPN